MISIAMATYNGEKFLRDQIDSILMQTYRDFELIICDDSSTDSTPVILSEYQCNYPHIHWYQNKKRLGFKRNFEKAAMLCKNDLIAFSDQDDIWTNEHLEILYKNIGSNAMICSNTKIINKMGKHTRRTGLANMPYLLEHNYPLILLSLFFRNFARGCTILFRKSLLIDAFPIPDTVRYHDYWLAIIAASKGGITYKNTATVFYRRHDNNETKFTMDIFRRHSDWLQNIASMFSESYFRMQGRLPAGQLIVYKIIYCFYQNANTIDRLKFFFDYYHLIYWDKSIIFFMPRVLFKIIYRSRRKFELSLNKEIHRLIGEYQSSRKENYNALLMYLEKFKRAIL